MSVVAKTFPIDAESPLSEIADAFVCYTFIGDEICHFAPEGRFEILFQDDFLFHNKSGNQGWKARPRGFIGGLHSQSYFVKPGADNSSCFGIKLKPTFTRCLIPDALHNFKNTIVDVEDVFGSGGKVLLEKLDSEKDQDIKFDLVEQFMITRIRPLKPRLQERFEEIIWNDCSVSVKQLASLSNRSCSHFRRLFSEEVGLAPQEFIKVVRTKKAVHHLRSDKYETLTSLAYSLGFFDQAHFIRDFKSVTGVTPSQYNSLAATV